jgi:hypothetical protein
LKRLEQARAVRSHKRAEAANRCLPLGGDGFETVMQQFSGGASLRGYLPRPRIDKALRA